MGSSPRKFHVISKILYHLVKTEKEDWPLLFLYSKKDYWISYQYINEVVHFKKTQNPSRIISAKLFESAEHVNLVRKYPQEYKSEIKQFLDQCNTNNF